MDHPVKFLSLFKNVCSFTWDLSSEDNCWTFCWFFDLRSVLKAKRRLLKYPDGFKAQFYTLSEIVTPVLAWGFFGKFPFTPPIGPFTNFFLLNLRSGRESQHHDALLQGPDAGLCARPLQLSDCQVGEGDIVARWTFLSVQFSSSDIPTWIPS